MPSGAFPVCHIPRLIVHLRCRQVKQQSGLFHRARLFALGIEAEAFDVWLKLLQGHGVTIKKEVEWPRGGNSLYFRDPAGNSVELVTPGAWGLPSPRGGREQVAGVRPDTPIVPGRYRHYKGKGYTVICGARHSETQAELVVYRQEYGDQGL